MKVRCNRALDSICPLKNKCPHYRVHNHKGIYCENNECFLVSDGSLKINVECIEIKEKEIVK